jgi:hypothetical protein
MSAWLAAAYALLALGLAWTLTSGIGWRRRAPFIVCTPALALALWLGKPNPAGWPSTAGVPKQAGLLWASVTEPDPASADPGRIYLWLDTGHKAPRAYSLPYTRSLHQQVQRALNRLKGGQPVAMRRSTASRTKKGGKQHQRASGSRIHLVVNAPVLLPPKTH